MPDINHLITIDPWLSPYRQDLQARQDHYLWVKKRLIDAFGSLENASHGDEFFGFNRGEEAGAQGWWYREWAPGAMQLNLIGDFNKWDRSSHPLLRDTNGVWSIFIPDHNGQSQLEHLSHLKVHVLNANGARDRIPAYIKKVTLLPDGSYTGQHYAPPPYTWLHPKPPTPKTLHIYEVHIGMAQDQGQISSFAEFTSLTLPRIYKQGYNAIQIMAVMQHPYYGSFGYQVSNFFAVSHYFGSPQDLKILIDTAHSLGIRVFLDIVHSHSVKNYDEGLNHFDGTDGQYFHSGARGLHPDWDTRLFDYGQLETLRFLLSNIRFWIEEYHFDGFRFDGVTSMLYLDHGHRDFLDYSHYFNSNVDKDALAYLQLANEVAHQSSSITTIAEEVSGIPGLARPIDEGGLGFDYRLAMGIPDFWIKLLKTQADETWSIQNLYSTLINRRRHENHVAYAESHDQSFVGDKTIAFWLMDAHMYTSMDKNSHDPIIDRGIALHKIIRLLTFFLGGEAWLNFIGNEFGHPEWVDFPRAGNNYSYHYARRQWSLCDNPKLRYQFLNHFDQQLMSLDHQYQLLAQDYPDLLYLHEEHKCLLARRGSIILIVNLHPTVSYPDYKVGVPRASNYQILLNTDDSAFGGFNRITSNQLFPYTEDPFHSQPGSIKVYLPSRTALVLKDN